ncbi:MAG TPA: hypothetical protein VGO52_10700 [Hyphomonadaceae bacterium]|nr:hypothetical protein [Hyphomonadaceae bacterium]
MGKGLDEAETKAREIADEWMTEGQRWASIPGASLAMFQVDHQMMERMAEAFEVKRPTHISFGGPFWHAYGLAWARCSLDATFGFNAWVLPWVSPDLRAEVLKRTTERACESTIAKLRAQSPLQ